MSPRRREGPTLNKQTGYFFFDNFVGLNKGTRRVRYTLKTRDPKEAEFRWKQEYRRQWDKYYGVASGLPAPVQTFKPASADFIIFEREVKHVSEWKMYESRLRIVAEIIGDVALDEIKQAEIRKIDAWLAGHGREKYTRNHYFGLLRAFFNWAIHEHRTTGENPVRAFRPYVVDAKRREYSDDEIKKIIAAAGQVEMEAPKNARVLKLTRRIVLMLLYTGMRWGELKNLRWENIRSDRIVFRRTETKQRKEKIIPITAGLAKILDEFKAADRGDGYVLPVQDRKKNADTKWIIRRIRELSGVSDFVLHGLRHTAATIMVAEALGRGAGLQDIMGVLGHAAISTTLQYDHSNLARMKMAMEMLESKLGK